MNLKTLHAALSIATEATGDLVDTAAALEEANKKIKALEAERAKLMEELHKKPLTSQTVKSKASKD